MDVEAMDRHLQNLAAVHGRKSPSIEYVRQYTDRVGPSHPEDLAVAVEVWAERDHFPTPLELREEIHVARLARLRLEANERQRSGPVRRTASPEVVRSRLAAMRATLAAASGPTVTDLYASEPVAGDPVLARP